MEIQVHQRLTVLIALAALLAAIPVSAQSRKEKADSLVRLMKAESLEQLEMNGQQYRKAIKSTFLHNGTYLISDTALWNVDTKIINAYGHVKVMQDETILTSDKLDYIIDDNLAQFRGTLVQLQNKKKNLLRTRHLDYNTQDSVAIFHNGASMRDADGNIIESFSGTYNSHDKMFIFDDAVNMFSDSVFVKTNRLFYYSETERAEFPTFIDFWKDGNMLSAERGWYDRPSETVFFERSVHALSEKQEAWADTMYYYKGRGDLLMLGRAQVQDPSRDVIAVAEQMHYNDTLSEIRLKRNAAVTLITKNDSKRDTIYMGADTLVYKTIRHCDINEGVIGACETRLSDIMTDAVLQYRQSAAKAAAEAAAEAKKKQGTPGGKKPDKEQPQQQPKEQETPVETKQPQAPEEPAAEPPVDSLAAAEARKDSLLAPLNKALAAIDSLTGNTGRMDSLAVPPVAVKDSLAAKDTTSVVDSVAADATDSLAAQEALPPPDTTKIGFVYGINKVRIFRRDMQMRCDSMCYCDLDSIARFYKDPIIWNEGRRQYTADSIMVLVGGGGIRKASLLSNAFVAIQEDTVSYDQIKGTEIMAFFDSLENSLKRFDALGGASGIFFLHENDAFATVNKVESDMLSGLLKDGDIEQVFYYKQPKNNAYPVVQLPESEKRMKGFNWRPEERPRGPEDITVIAERKSERYTYETKPRPAFRQTDIYFPGYMKQIMREIAVRDSIAKAPKPEPAPVVTDTVSQVITDSLTTPLEKIRPEDKPQAADSLGVRASADSLAAPADSLAAPADSLAAAKDSLASPGATQAVKPAEETDPLSVPTTDPKQKKKEERELKRKLRIAARDARIAAKEARWAELDRRDSIKLAEKKQKEIEKERAKKLRTLLSIRKQEAKDEAKLAKYIEKYRKQYEREQKRKASRKRTPAVEPGGEVPPAPGPGKETPRGDAILGDDGSPDDDPVLRGGGVPGT